SLNVRPAGYSGSAPLDRIAVEGKAGETEIRLPRVSRVKLVLTEPDGRELKSGVRSLQARLVSLAEPRMSMRHEPSAWRASAIEFAGLAPGGYELVVKDFEIPALRSRIDVPPGANVDLGKVALPRSLRLSGRVRDAEGRPLGGAVVHLFADP